MSTPSPPEKLAYTVREFCQASGLSHTSVYKLMATGELQTKKVCGRRLIPRDSALRLFEQPGAADGLSKDAA